MNKKVWKMNIITADSPFTDSPEETSDFYRPNRRSYQMLASTLPAPREELLYCRQITHTHLLGGTHYHKRHADELSVEHVEQGEVLFRNEGATHALEGGEIFLFQPGRMAEFMVPEGRECIKHSLQITGRLLPEFLRTSGLGGVSVLTGADLPRLTGFFRDFEALLKRHDPEEARENGARCYTLLQFLQSPGAPENRPPQLTRLLECLNTRSGEELPLEELAEFCCTSPAHLIRLCRRHFGQTPHRMLLAIRMRRAAALLLANELSVKEIAAQAGYSSAQNFATEFRKLFGCPPRSYRQNTIID